MAGRHREYWTNPSVLRFAGDSDPIELVTRRAREEVLLAIQAGWQGPPFDPFRLANFLGISTIPREDVLDARLVPAGSRRAQIEFNPNKARGRTRFSIAHEIAHTLFPDCIQNVRNRGQMTAVRSDDWQLELLCNIAAAEILMPVGSEIDPQAPITIDNLLRLQKEFDVSTEAISIRAAKITLEPCTIFAAARTTDGGTATYRFDYGIPSRTSPIQIPKGLQIRDSILSQCTAIGYTAKGVQQDVGTFKELYLECVGVPPYPGRNYPRFFGVARQKNGQSLEALNVTLLRGNALEPRGTGTRIIAHIVNDKAPNWGAGFARAVRNKYPEVQRDFKEWASLNPQSFKLGGIHASIASPGLYVASMVAQRGYGESIKPRIRYAALRECLQQLREIALDRGAQVHMPRIGTGYAGGNWAYILELIDETLTRKGIDVTVYILPGYERPETQGVFRLDTGIQAGTGTKNRGSIHVQ
jgi:O-acetyl-ADP-ribose deacetylase (regulator of RNase III)